MPCKSIKLAIIIKTRCGAKWDSRTGIAFQENYDKENKNNIVYINGACLTLNTLKLHYKNAKRIEYFE